MTNNKKQAGRRANSRRTMVRHLWHGRYMLMPLDALLWENKTFTYTETFEYNVSSGNQFHDDWLLSFRQVYLIRGMG